MAEEAPPDAEAESSESEASPKSGLVSRFQKAARKNWLSILVVGALVAQGAGIAYFAASRGPVAQRPGYEITLGAFHFEDNHAERSHLRNADFRLHIRFIASLESNARRRLEMRQYAVQQDIEELLRQAHGADFEDPVLGELKRQLQEQINRTLEMRAVSEVIVTDLQVDEMKKSTKREVAGSSPFDRCKPDRAG